MIAEVLTYSSPPMTRARLHISRRGCWFEPARSARHIIARYFARRYGIELTSRRGKPWTPRDLGSDLLVWVRAGKRGPVDMLRDRSGHGRHLVAPVGRGPTVVSAISPPSLRHSPPEEDTP